MTSLADRLPPRRRNEPPDPDALFGAFVDWASAVGLTLYPHQEQAVLELVTGSNVILATPTGSGKSMVAAAAHFFALADFARTGDRTYYTAPIKALVSEKFFTLCAQFGAENVGMITGDASVNAQAPIVCCTAEILANLSLRQGEHLDVASVVMDEFHFYSDPDRGWAWQVPLLTLPQAQFLLMSATLGDVSFFRDELTRRTGRDTAVVDDAERPVPLSYSYSTDPLPEKLEELIATRQAPVYVVHFTQKDALERAQALMSMTVATREERNQIAEMLGGLRFGKGFGTRLSKLVRHGIGVHHAGMLPKYRRIVETLTQAGLLKVVCGTDTLGVGINVPIRTVVLTGLAKFDGSRQRILRVREFHQIAGRAGRAGFDTTGSVVVQAPEHVIENERALAKAGDDPRKQRKVQRKKAPDGFVSWSEETFARLVEGQPEALQSRMRVTHAMVLDVIARATMDGSDPVRLMRRLLTASHETPRRQAQLQRQAVEILRSLIDAEVVEAYDIPGQHDAAGRPRRGLRLVDDLQAGFALNQPLSTFAVVALELLDDNSPTYALDVVSVIEATLEDPRPVLWAQQRKARGEALAEMKAEGMDYSERMELLDDITWPTPLDDLLGVAYETYRGSHPWLTDDLLSPKSVVREMFENARGFGEFVRVYDLARSEGVVLRYLTDAYRALRQTVPEVYRTQEVDGIIDWLGELVRRTDSSLLDEWEALTHPDRQLTGDGEVRPTEPAERPITANPRLFRLLVRQAMWRRVDLLSRGKVDQLAALDSGVHQVTGLAGDDPAPLTGDDWDDALAEYEDEYGQVPESIGTGAQARSLGLLRIETHPDGLGVGAKTAHSSARRTWQVQQILEDPEGERDWRIVATIDLDASDDEDELVLWVTDLAPVT